MAVLRGEWREEAEEGGMKKTMSVISLVAFRGDEEQEVVRFTSVTPHEWDNFALELSLETIASMMPGDVIEARVKVCSKGHLVHLRSAALQASCDVEAVKELVAVKLDSSQIEKLKNDLPNIIQTRKFPKFLENISREDVNTVFGFEILELLTTCSAELDEDRMVFKREEIITKLERFELFFKWAMKKYAREPFLDNRTYAWFCEETNSAVSEITEKLINEFARLVDVKDTVAIQKIVALHHLGLADDRFNVHEIDLSRITRQHEFERETAILVIQMWADSKIIPNQDLTPSSLKQAAFCLQALDQAQSHTQISTRFKSDNDVFMGLRDWIAEIAGIDSGSIDPGTGHGDANVVSYKPLSSIFNKAYIRRGQMRAASILGDLRRATFYVKTQDELDHIARNLENAFPDNYKKKIDKWKGNCIDQLHEIAKLESVTLKSGSSVTIYRFKANSSQKEKSVKSVYNLNFFIGKPNFYSTGMKNHYITACEIQIGLTSEINGLREDHEPYERQRILESLPLLAAYKEGHCHTGANPDFDYESIKRALFKRQFPHIDRRKTYNFSYKPPDGVIMGTETHRQLPRGLKIINDCCFDSYSSCGSIVCWEKNDLDPRVVHSVEELFVDIADQGWGNNGLLFGLAMQVGPDLVMLSVRGFHNAERELYTNQGGIFLVRNSYNFSAFSDKTIIPRGVSKIMIIACGRVGNNGHQMYYRGHQIRITVIKEKYTDV
uniref:Uncharacterized protein n=1 Tax=Ditylum brightwellii TaxID=49249 RepID=A0A7S1ZSV4_9STRA